MLIKGVTNQYGIRTCTLYAPVVVTEDLVWWVVFVGMVGQGWGGDNKAKYNGWANLHMIPIEKEAGYT